MLNTYKLAQGPLGRAMILRIATVCAALHLLWTFPGGVGGMARVMRGEDAIEWSVIRVFIDLEFICVEDFYSKCCSCGMRVVVVDCQYGYEEIDVMHVEGILFFRKQLKAVWPLISFELRQGLIFERLQRGNVILSLLSFATAERLSDLLSAVQEVYEVDELGGEGEE
jgi:hypothetical protein